MDLCGRYRGFQAMRNAYFQVEPGRVKKTTSLGLFKRTLVPKSARSVDDAAAARLMIQGHGSGVIANIGVLE